MPRLRKPREAKVYISATFDPMTTRKLELDAFENDVAVSRRIGEIVRDYLERKTTNEAPCETTDAK